MAAQDKIVMGVSNAANDVEKVSVAYLIANEGLKRGKQVVMWLTGEGVRLSQQGYSDDLQAEGAAAVRDLHQQFVAAGGQYYACPVCFNARKLDPDKLVEGAAVKGAVALLDFSDDGAMVYNY